MNPHFEISVVREPKRRKALLNAIINLYFLPGDLLRIFSHMKEESMELNRLISFLLMHVLSTFAGMICWTFCCSFVSVIGEKDS